MSKLRRLIGLVLSVTIFLSLVFCPILEAFADNRNGIINGTGVAFRRYPNTNSSADVMRRLNYPDQVIVISEVEGEEPASEKGNGNLWYLVGIADGTHGYVYHRYVTIITPAVSADVPDFETQLSAFPESYHSYLRALHATYPNWIFNADKLNMSFEEAVNGEYTGTKNLSLKMVPTNWDTPWRSMQPDAYDSDSGTWKVSDGTSWYFASKGAIAYYMDPRNFLDAKSVFMFAQQNYDASLQNADGVRSIINNTFLALGYDTDGDSVIEADAYVNDIMYAAQLSGVSPYVIAGTIISEQGTVGSSPLISGNYAGYEGYYNFFNFGAAGIGSEVYTSGLSYAKSQNWSSRRDSIVGGAIRYGNNYIKRGQNTYYYKNYNVIVDPYYSHQYAANVRDSYNNADRMSKGFVSNPGATLIFNIPVFTSIPDAVTVQPTENDVIISEPTVPDDPPDPTPADDPQTGSGSGDTDPPAVIKKGDINSDGVIDIIDFAIVRMYLLDLRELTGDSFERADINSDGEVDIIDFARIRKHLLEIELIN